MNHKISIIIPIYNTEKLLIKCLDSVLNQTYKNLEIILIDDGSTDNSLDICYKYAKKDKRIKVYTKKNGGVSSARNLGIEKANGEFIMFVDADDIINERMCEILIHNYTTNCMSVVNYEIIHKKILNSNVNEKIITEFKDNKYIGLFTIYQGVLWNKLYITKIIRDNNIKLNENITMCEDLLFNFQYLKYVDKVIYDDRKLYGYYIHNTNASRKINEKWFSYIIAHNEIMAKLNNYDLITQNYILLFYLYGLFEAKVRLKLLNKSFARFCNDNNINYSVVKIKYYKRVMSEKNIPLKYKFKLFIFYKLYPIAYLIKKSKIMKGK